MLLFGELRAQQSHLGLQFELPRRWLSVGKDGSCIVKQMPLPVTKPRLLQLIPVAQITDGNPIKMMLPKQLRLLRWSPILPSYACFDPCSQDTPNCVIHTGMPLVGFGWGKTRAATHVR